MNKIDKSFVILLICLIFALSAYASLSLAWGLDNALIRIQKLEKQVEDAHKVIDLLEEDIKKDQSETP